MADIALGRHPIHIEAGEDRRLSSGAPGAPPDPSAEVKSSRSRIAWIGGAEPLEHPEIARVTSALLAANRFVFLETDGRLLRRRIHEFKPVPRLFLTLRFDCGAAPAEREEAHDVALQAIRVAKLSGFLICANLVIHANSELGELELLKERLATHDVDGMLVSPDTLTAEAAAQAEAARRQLLSWPWTKLSALVSASAAKTRARARDFVRGVHSPDEGGECEEGAQA